MHNFDGKGLSLTQTNSEKELLKISAQLDKSCSKYLFLVKGKENELWTDSNKNSQTKQFNTLRLKFRKTKRRSYNRIFRLTSALINL